MPSANIVVYVEDDLDDQDLLKAAFQPISDHALVTLASGADLFSYLPSHHQSVCLVVLDINLPTQDGVSILRQIRDDNTYKEVQVVMFTTGINSPQTRSLGEMGVPVVEKPDTFRDLEKVVEKLLSYCLHHMQ